MSNPDSTHFRFKDITGFKSGMLTAVRFVERNRHRQTVWECLCDCGGFTRMVGNNLTNGHIKSCGCTQYTREPTSRRISGEVTPEYKAWKAMWQRCTNTKGLAYRLYSVRTPPECWRDFETFHKDMGPRPGPEYSIDRIDNDRPYGPTNCRWATNKTQQRDKSTNLRVDLNGERVSLAEACERLGLRYWLVYPRITRLGWTFEDAATNEKVSMKENNQRRHRKCH